MSRGNAVRSPDRGTKHARIQCPTMLLDRLVSQIIWLISAAIAAFLIAAAAAPLPPPPPQPSSNCQRKCGSVDIPYPFGIRSGSPTCCARQGFYLTCNDTGNGVYRPFSGNVEVLSISVEKSQARMLNHISSACYNNTAGEMNYSDWHFNFTNSPYRISDADNKFTVIGCRTLAYIADSDNVGKLMSGCVATCRRGDITSLTSGSCSGIGCCQTAIPRNMQFYQVWFDERFDTKAIHNVSNCSYAVLMESSNFTFQTSYATSHEFFDTYGGRVPLVMDWAIGKESCEVAQRKPESYACVSANSECIDSQNWLGYTCNCSKGFRGNPYLQDPELGCKDIDECKDLSNPCSENAICNNIPGGFICTCPPHYTKGSAGTCVLEQGIPLKAKLAIGLCASVLVALIAFLGKEWILHKRRILSQEYMRKINQCFEMNGGQLLIDMMKVESNISFKLYGRQEVELATNNFHESAIIGQGGQGTVYIGHNLDPYGNPVAIKRCKGFNESRRMDFAKELLILSRVNHENIVKLLGCSLQFDVPVLVYEFVQNKTLHYLMHAQDNASIRTMAIRLNIARSSAEALAYLHSLNHPILHGDVKSANILLGHDLSAKVSDFGCSMIWTTDENVPAVKGTMGYLDPEYLLKFELTDKSDVYSFGVILLEILTRKKVVSKGECLPLVFQEAVRMGKLDELVDFEIIDDQDNIDVVHQMAELAGRCLVVAGENRPTMGQVADELRLLEGVLEQRQGMLPNRGIPPILPEMPITYTCEHYSEGEPTHYYSLNKRASMSIEFAR